MSVSAPFRLGWWSFDLGRYRPCDSTYCLYPYESLPPLPALDGTLSWLGPLPSTVDDKMQVHRNAPEERGEVAKLAEAARGLGLALPAPFMRLMSSPDLQDRIPSCTACYFELSSEIVRCPGVEQAYLLRFLRDQQDVLTWYLYLTPDGGHSVLVSAFDQDDLEDANIDVAAFGNHTFACAPTFEEFVYRFWLENSIWFKLNDTSGTMTAEENAYLAHYSKANADG